MPDSFPGPPERREPDPLRPPRLEGSNDARRPLGEPGAPRRSVDRAEVTLANGRLAAIAQGKEIPPEIHPAVKKETYVLDVQRFNLWYGEKQALFDVGLGIPKG